MDISFTNHPSDKNHTKWIRDIAYNNKVTLVETKEILLGYLLVRWRIVFEIVEREIPKIEAFFAKKLKDSYEWIYILSRIDKRRNYHVYYSM